MSYSVEFLENMQKNPENFILQRYSQLLYNYGTATEKYTAVKTKEIRIFRAKITLKAKERNWKK